MSEPRCLIYGAYGYTGELTARFAAERGMHPILAGRNPAKTEAVAKRFGFEARSFGLNDPTALQKNLDGISVVLHCAGPFEVTSKPMLDACLAVKAHYLDITGEIQVFEAAQARDAEAQAAGICVMPGTGFDVVPSDCLALHLKQRLPDATFLRLAFMGLTKTSHGTATTMVRNLGKSGLVRRGGEIVDSPLGSLTRVIDFGEVGEQHCMAIPWGDVSTAYFSTGIPNIEVYTRVPKAAAVGARIADMMPALMGSSFVKGKLQRRIDQGPAGPTDEQRARGASFLWGEVENAGGKRVVSRLKTPEGYSLTADASLKVVEAAFAGKLPGGFQTPATALGADFVLDLENVRREDLL
ncbi:MAG: saccharopine dehydrogenase NADP-binding domain-containing protein [Myxococcales bacterium]|nr:saccharopine dehydrogenase NADP-binding domain-containing protein [Myxococcales bacterium]MCB9607346.1 saccharopine dehydrogenase NADP-binding domain-containing protein [Polyangiaceae bacterium]